MAPNNNTNRNPTEITLDDAPPLAGTFLTPQTKVPGVLFVHGWGGSQDFDLSRARGIAALGCVCLTFDLRGHAATEAQRREVSREQNLRDVLAAYDRLAAHPSLDTTEIAVVGSSYGGYLAAILTTLRRVRWLALHVPALYRDEEWDRPKAELDRDVLREYRLRDLKPADNRALGACADFPGDVLLVEAEHDTYIPHSTIMNYRSAFRRAHSMTHRVIDGADHALSDKTAQRAYTSVLVNWVTEMVTGARLSEPRALP
ncbi:alpha/beta hydrolase [Bordetella genomosp. 1]|uniref:Alpha/beta hydrolase n=1 Tax=Bordetella genomosp. 1 TaxID=1395607 RepID=A0A261SCZ2_9BORD|nr:alpha/beta fold hydrolase [Bordetella genomosp. 1]MDQ8032802.1 alpha/beta fold hydrolase [Bordetella sp.]OZI35269.1 alpha/beta hydrolase [Bordetella genomosp. 1]OZI63811.1 alpha/beta hydrolase [Bordetella genomosp. 1]